MATLKNIVISLTTATQRREHIRQEFGKQGIEFEFFNAVTISQLDMFAQKFNISTISPKLSQGEYACMFSHLCVLQKMLDENIEWLAIFEDDIYLGENAYLFLSTLDWIPQECQLIKLEHFYDKIMLGKVIAQHHHRSIQLLKSANLGMAGYIIHKNLAQEIIHYTQKLCKIQPRPIDHIVFDLLLKKHTQIHQLLPSICIQGNKLNNSIPSDLDIERKEHRQQYKVGAGQLTESQKRVREFKRIFHNVKLRIFSKPVYFK